MLHQIIIKMSRVQWEGEYGKGCCHVSHPHRGQNPFKAVTPETIQSPPPAAPVSDLRGYGSARVMLPASECQGVLSWVCRYDGGLICSEAKLAGSQGNETRQGPGEIAFCTSVWRWGSEKSCVTFSSVLSSRQLPPCLSLAKV